MKYAIPTIFSLAFSVGLNAQLKLDVQLQSRQPALLCEPMNMTVHWQNTGSTPIRVGKDRSPTQSKFVSLWINGVFKETMPLSSQTQLSGGDTAISPFGNNDRGSAEELAGGESRSGIAYLLPFLAAPGTYLIQVKADFTGQEESGFHGKAESNTLTVKIAAPEGKDKEYYDTAVKAATEHRSECLRAKPSDPIQPWEICGRLTSMETGEGRQLVARHPDSIYSAWAIYDRLILGEGWSPAKIKSVLDAGEFPANACSIPDPSNPNNLKNIYGKECTLWRNEQIKTILDAHPDFPFTNKLKLNYGIYMLSLGKGNVGITYLNEVAAKPTDDGRWATEFLTLWRSK